MDIRRADDLSFLVDAHEGLAAREEAAHPLEARPHLVPEEERIPVEEERIPPAGHGDPLNWKQFLLKTTICNYMLKQDR